MKTLVIAVVCTVIIWGCASSSEKKEDGLKVAIEQAQQSDETEKDLFLGFKFGMTEKEVDNHLDLLINEGKLYLNSEREYQYDLNTDVGMTLYINFIPKFHNDSLYEIVYPVKSSILSTGKEYILAASSFMKSDRKEGFQTFITKDALGDEVYTYIKNNLIITFDGSLRPSMKYTNAPIEKMVSDIKDQEKKDKAKESYSEF